MTDILLLVIALGMLAILAVVLRIAADLRALRVQYLPDMLASLGKLSRPLGPIPILPKHQWGHKLLPPPDVIYVVWEWRDGCWHVVSESEQGGVDPGVPPAYPGAFPGERIRTSESGRVL
jgi:hypothetical protein